MISIFEPILNVILMLFEIFVNFFELSDYFFVVIFY